VKAGYVGHLRLHSKTPTLHRRPVYGNQKLKVQLSQLQTWRSECGQTQVVQWEGRYVLLSIYSNGSADRRALQFVAHTCGERKQSNCGSDCSANEWGFRPPKLQKSSHGPIYKESTALNFKPWARFNINWWPSYGVTVMHNITGIRWFRQNVANCERWPTDNGCQLHTFCCSVHGLTRSLQNGAFQHTGV